LFGGIGLRCHEAFWGMKQLAAGSMEKRLSSATALDILAVEREFLIP